MAGNEWRVYVKSYVCVKVSICESDQAMWSLYDMNGSQQPSQLIS